MDAKKKNPGAGEKDQRLRALAALEEDLSSVSSIHVRWLTTPITPAPEGFNASDL